MDKRTKMISTAAIGFIVIAITLTLYFATSWRDSERMLSLVSLLFVLFAEISFFFVLLAIEMMNGDMPNLTFIWSGLSTSLAAYWIFTVVMAFINTNYYSDIVKFTLHETIATAILLITLIGLYVSAVKINLTDRCSTNNRKYMQDIERRLFVLFTSCENEQYKKQLEDICDMAKYSEKTKHCLVDISIEDEMTRLEAELLEEKNEDSAKKTEAALTKLRWLFERRLCEAAESGRGGC